MRFIKTGHDLCTFYFVLDNARYQHFTYVKQWATELSITLEFLPGYSPNLNLIERLWKYLKQILAQQYHSCKTTFENAIVSLLSSLNQSKHQERLSTGAVAICPPSHFIK